MTDKLRQLLDYPRLGQAWEKVRRNGGGPGSDGITLEQFARHLQANLWSLVTEVRAGSYQPRPLLAVSLRKPGKKPRKLAIPAVRDRVLQTLIAQHLTPRLEQEFEDVSYGYRAGRSVDAAVRRVMRLRDQGYLWVVDADISSYFDNINHQMLLLEASRFIADDGMLELIRQWLRAPIQDNDGCLWCPVKGIPQGSPLSPLLANLYLDWFDEQLLAQGYRLVRFADDFLILCRHEDDARQGLAITDELLRAMDLALNQQKSRVTHFDRGFRFLGVRFLRSLVMRSSMEDDAPLTDLRQVAARAKHRQEADIGQKLPPPPSTPLLRTLYVTGHGARLSHEGECILLHPRDKPVQRIPMRQIDQIMIIGNHNLTLPFIKTCMRHNLPLSLHTATGLLYGVIDSRLGGSIELQRRQFELAGDERACLALSKTLIKAKIHNTRVVLQRYARHHSLPAFDTASQPLKHCLRKARQATTLEALLGEEGSAARHWFQAWRHHFEDDWGFEGRRRRPPPDPVNALLSFGYTLLYQNVQTLLRTTGLHPGLGFLHKPRSGHAALASDILEIFRAPVVDALVLDLLLNDKLHPDDFSTSASGTGCKIEAAARQRFIHVFEKKMNSRFTHPASGGETDYRRCILSQVKSLCLWLQHPRHGFPALMIR